MKTETIKIDSLCIEHDDIVVASKKIKAGGLDTIAVRMPNHKIALELIEEACLIKC